MTIKIAHISDLHIDHRRDLPATGKVFSAFRSSISDNDVDIVLLPGDLFERRSTPQERNVLAEFLKSIAEIAPVWGCKGNHDAPEDLAIFTLLETEHPVWIEDRSTAQPGSSPIWCLDPHADVWDGSNEGRKIGLLALSWIDKSNYSATLDSTASAEEGRQGAIGAVRDLLESLKAEADRVRSVGAVPLLVARVMVGGSTLSSGQVLIGHGIELSASDLLSTGCAYIALGHIHKSQEWLGGQVAYSGSPDRHDYGETDDVKGWRLVTLEDTGEMISNELIELPARRLVRVEHDWSTDKGAEWLSDDTDYRVAIAGDKSVEGASVRFRYRVRAQDLHLVDDDVIERTVLEDGAIDVKIEAVIVQDVRARAPEIIEAKTTMGKVNHYLLAKEIDVGPEQMERLENKLGEIEMAE